MDATNWQIIIGALTILFSGVGAYVGIKVGQAKVERDIQALKDSDIALDRRVLRLEAPYFDRK